MINTIAFLILNIKSSLTELPTLKLLVICGFIVLMQVGLFLTLKLVFFKLVYEETHLY
jgi:hypothetical protein